MRRDGEVREQRSGEILDAALVRFSAFGFRRTAMDDIAREAGISRPLIYQYFPNKEAVFRALADRLHTAMLDTATRALASPGPLVDRLAGALVAKHRLVMDVAGSSEHRGEILDTSSRLAGDLAEEAERRLQSMLGDAIGDAARAGELDLPRGLTAAAVAGLLFDSSKGVVDAASHGPHATAWEHRLHELTALVIGGLQPRH